MELSVGDFGGVCQASVCRIVVRVSGALAKRQNEYIRMPETADERFHACYAFWEKAKFPRTIGAIDCTHVKIQSPGGPQAETYRNRKGWFSLNVQTIASADLKVLNVITKWPCATHDSAIFYDCQVRSRFERGDFGNYFLVSDGGYKNTRYLATPFLTHSVGANQRETAVRELYNASQIRTRQCVERSYGVLKRRFPILSMGMRLRDLNTVRNIIVSCCILHNFAIDANDALPDVDSSLRAHGFADMMAATFFNQGAVAGHQTNTNGTTIRDKLFASYFARIYDTGEFNLPPVE